MKKAALVIMIVVVLVLVNVVPAFADQPPWAPPEFAYGEMGDRASDFKCGNGGFAALSASGTGQQHGRYYNGWLNEGKDCR